MVSQNITALTFLLINRYVKDRLPGIEEADLDNEDAVRQLMHECQVEKRVDSKDARLNDYD